MTKLRFVAALIAGALIGCVAQPFIVPAATAQSGVQRWDYFCFSVYGQDQLQPKAKEAGGQGWELVSVTSDQGGNAREACFKRPL